MSFLLAPARRAASSASSNFRQFSTSSQRSLARITLVGRLGTEPETQENGDSTIVKHVLGTNYGKRDNQQTSWFRITSFVNSNQESRLQFLTGLEKGTLIYLEGDAQMKTYQDKDGKTQSALNIIQTKIDVLKRPRKEEAEQETSS